MNDNHWNPSRQDQPEQNYYQTGSTQPPKSRRGLLAVLLVAVIFLGGIASVLGLLNIKLFWENLSLQEEETPVSFSKNDADQSEDPSNAGTTDSSATNNGVSIELSQTPEAVANVPQSGGLSLQEIYEKNISSVVSITCQTPSGTSTGTGVVFSRDGYVVTNCHVVEGAYEIALLLSSGETLSAQLVGSDAASDLAVLYAEGKTLIPAEFGRSGSVRVGDAVVAIGDPLGTELRGTMTDGIVSAINRDITVSGRTMTLIQTNAALNAGNSGGPLINCYGQVVGINTMKIGDYMNAAGVEGLGFAIPSTTVKDVVDQLMRHGFVTGRPSLGFTAEPISSFMQLYYNLPQGLYITAVDSGSNAQAQGVTAGDILLALDGQRITDTDTLQTILYAHNAGDTVEAILYRAGRQYTTKLTFSQATK